MTLSDIDECLTGAHHCSVFATCDNMIGTYTCTCLPGYVGNGTVCKGRPSHQYVCYINAPLSGCWHSILSVQDDVLQRACSLEIDLTVVTV